MNEKIHKLEISLEKNELLYFLTGKKREYHFVCRDGEMPTDPVEVFDAIKEYSIQNVGIWKKFQDEIIEMSKNPDYAWLTLYYLMIYLYYSKSKRQDFINIDLIIRSIIVGLNKNKINLINNKNWAGKQFPRGQWDNSKRLINNINIEFKLELKLEDTL